MVLNMSTTTRKPRARKAQAAPKAAPKTEAFKPSVTVAIPTIDNAEVIYLALESMLRQTYKEKFEVIIHECPSAHPSTKIVTSYVGKFDERGITIRYKMNDAKQHLGNKWRQMADEATGDVLIMVAADCFSPTTLVAQTVEAFAHGCDWSQNENGVFFDFLTGRMAEYRGENGRNALNFAAKTEAIRTLPPCTLGSGIDKFIWEHVKPKNVARLDTTDGLHTDGFNHISKSRRGHYTGTPQRPFHATDKTIGEVVPKDIAERILEQSEGLLKKRAAAHGIGVADYALRHGIQL